MEALKEVVIGALQGSNSFYTQISGISFVCFAAMGLLVAPRMSLRNLKAYSSFSNAQKADWDTRVGSNVHAVIVSLIAVYCLALDEETNANPIWSQAVLVRSGISLTLGYIIADFLLLLFNYRLIGDTFTLTHHLMAMMAYYFVVIYGVLPYFANFRQLAEVSTFFVNQRWYYSAIKEPHSSRRFLTNAWCMAISFFLFRIAVMPFYYYKCYQVWGSQEQRSLGMTVTYFWLGTCVILDIINIFWMGKMIKGGQKVLHGNTKSKGS